MDEQQCRPLAAWTAQLPDPRGRRGWRYSWPCPVRPLAAAFLTHGRGSLAMHEWVEAQDHLVRRHMWLRAWREIPADPRRPGSNGQRRLGSVLVGNRPALPGRRPASSLQAPHAMLRLPAPIGDPPPAAVRIPGRHPCLNMQIAGAVPSFPSGSQARTLAPLVGAALTRAGSPSVPATSPSASSP